MGQAANDIIRRRKGANSMPVNWGMSINTNSYLILIAFPQQQWLRERFSLLEYAKRTLPVFFITHVVVNLSSQPFAMWGRAFGYVSVSVSDKPAVSIYKAVGEDSNFIQNERTDTKISKMHGVRSRKNVHLCKILRFWQWWWWMFFDVTPRRFVNKWLRKCQRCLQLSFFKVDCRNQRWPQRGLRNLSVKKKKKEEEEEKRRYSTW